MPICAGLRTFLIPQPWLRSLEHDVAEEGRLGSDGAVMVSRFNPRRSNRVLPRFSTTDTTVCDCMVERNAAIFDDDKVPCNAVFCGDKESGSTAAHHSIMGGNAAICNDKASGHVKVHEDRELGSIAS